MTLFQTSPLCRLHIFWLAALVVLAGCGDQGARGLKLDKAVARDSLIACLDSWKQGKQQADMKQHAPPIIAKDGQWETGHKLSKYNILDKDTDDGTNARIEVELFVIDKQGRASQNTASYFVGTSPVITVFRE